MTQVFTIQIELLSDTTFSRGDGVAGLIDREVEYDNVGLPFLHGRTLKGLLGEEADNLLDAMEAGGKQIKGSEWLTARNVLFGQGGSEADERSRLHFSHAQLPEAIRQNVQETMKWEGNRLTAQDVLASLTAVRRQTAIDPDGVQHGGSLRSMRVILRQTRFYAECRCQHVLNSFERTLLAASVLALRRGGTGRNRGRGRLKVDLLENGVSILPTEYDNFQKMFKGTKEASS